MGLVTQGNTNKAIANKLGLSLDTVGSHLKRAYDKLGVRSRAAAATRFVELGLSASVPTVAPTLEVLTTQLDAVWRAAAQLDPAQVRWLVEHNHYAMRDSGVLG